MAGAHRSPGHTQLLVSPQVPARRGKQGGLLPSDGARKWEGEGGTAGTLMGQGGCPPPREEGGDSCDTAPSQHPASPSPSPSSSRTHAHTSTRPGAVVLVFRSQGAPGSSKTGGLMSPKQRPGQLPVQAGNSPERRFQRLSLLLARAPASSLCSPASQSLSC